MKAAGRLLAGLAFLASMLGGGVTAAGCHAHVHPGPAVHRHPHLRGHRHRVCHRHPGHWRWHCHP